MGSPPSCKHVYPALSLWNKESDSRWEDPGPSFAACSLSVIRGNSGAPRLSLCGEGIVETIEMKLFLLLLFCWMEAFENLGYCESGYEEVSH
ncbi:unnamed protein product [Victoria cruziana]